MNIDLNKNSGVAVLFMVKIGIVSNVWNCSKKDYIGYGISVQYVGKYKRKVNRIQQHHINLSFLPNVYYNPAQRILIIENYKLHI